MINGRRIRTGYGEEASNRRAKRWKASQDVKIRANRKKKKERSRE